MLLLVLAAIACYSTSLAPVTWVIISEIFPNRIRGAAMSVAVASLWMACFILTYTFPSLNAALAPGRHIPLYAVVCACGFPFHLVQAARNEGQNAGTARDRSGRKQWRRVDFGESAIT